MSQKQDIKIRLVPKSSDKRPQGDLAPSESPKPKALKGGRLWLANVMLALLCGMAMGAFGIYAFGPRHPHGGKNVVALEQASVSDPQSQRVSRHLQDSHMKEEILRRTREMENRQLSPVDGSQPLFQDDEERPLGVQLDQDESMEKLYRDLNYRQYRPANEFLPDERIKARLANRRWVSQEERAERIQFVRNFIRSAYDRGYQVQLDQNLVVVGVKKITEPRKVDIEKVMDQLAKQGL